MRPVDIDCPNCLAPAGSPCTQPTAATRKPVDWFHSARENAAAEEYVVTEPTPEPEPAAKTERTPEDQLADVLYTIVSNDDQAEGISCDCGHGAGEDATSREKVAEIIRHAAYAHATRRDLFIVRIATLVDSYELGILLRLPAANDAEQRRRDADSTS